MPNFKFEFCNCTSLFLRGVTFRRIIFKFTGKNCKLNSIQESLAIAKTTARYAQYMGALKSFESRRKRPRLLFTKFEKCFCSDRY